MIKAVLFDMDGTLVNSEKYYVDGTMEWTKRIGKPFTLDQASKIVGITMEDTYKYLSNELKVSIDEAKRMNEEYFNQNILNYQNYKFDDVEPTLKELKKRNIKIMICSMSPTSYVTQCIKDLKLEEYIDYYFGGDKVTKQKPDPESYLMAMKQFGLNKDECIVVEDSYNGILASKTAGIKTYARKDKQFGIDQSCADIILENLTDLLKEI